MAKRTKGALKHANCGGELLRANDDWRYRICNRCGWQLDMGPISARWTREVEIIAKITIIHKRDK